MTLIFAPVSLPKPGPRRCSGSAICGPVNVNTFTVTPSNGFGAAVTAGTDSSTAATSSAREIPTNRFTLLTSWSSPDDWLFRAAMQPPATDSSSGGRTFLRLRVDSPAFILSRAAADAEAHRLTLQGESVRGFPHPSEPFLSRDPPARRLPLRAGRPAPKATLWGGRNEGTRAV